MEGNHMKNIHRRDKMSDFASRVAGEVYLNPRGPSGHLRDHDHDVFYCPSCKAAFSPAEVFVETDGGGNYWADCPGIGGDECQAVSYYESDGIEKRATEPTRMKADGHLEKCEEAVIA